jgi:hypothetical protein
MAYGTVNADVIGTSVANSNLGAGNATRFKNKIINGDFRIDQRNAGAQYTTATTAAYTYTLDRWAYYANTASKFTVQQNAGSVTAPVGFTNYAGITSTSAYTLNSSDSFLFAQFIEGLNVQDLAWGTANAKTITLSFWVYSSLTGTFGGALANGAYNRSYPFSYTVSSANTWTQISITIAGDTTGTWVTNNGLGLRVTFGLGVNPTSSGTAGSWSANAYLSSTGATSVVSTNAATWYVTGVQLEVGSSATGFEVVDYTTQLIMCQRYFEKSYSQGTAVATNTSVGLYYGFYQAPLATGVFYVQFCAEKRTAPTMTGYTATGVSGNWYDSTALGNLPVVFGFQSTRGGGYVQLTGGTGASQSGHWLASAEL